LAQYADQQSIMRIIDPVIVEPLAKEWEVHALRFRKNRQTKKSGDKAERDAQAVFLAFKVLEPACGSGTFFTLHCVR